MRNLLLAFSSFLLISLADCIAQNYSYSFTGYSDTLTLNSIGEKIANSTGVKEVKWHYKSEKEAGEFIIFTLNYADKKDPYPFDPTQVKSILISHKLSPLNLLELPN